MAARKATPAKAKKKSPFSIINKNQRKQLEAIGFKIAPVEAGVKKKGK